jgi:toxin ParE1/3/4
MNYIISKEASKDLEKIWLYTFENWSIQQADRYINLIIDEIEYLTSNPKSGKSYNEIRKGYFCSRVKSHFIFYKINSKLNKIQVMRILHQSMNIESRLSE